MIIAEHITEQSNRLNLAKLTPKQCQWLHGVRTLATWAYIAKTWRETEAKKKAP
jgi:hypothetical protein